jgi:hypothetical protein
MGATTQLSLFGTIGDGDFPTPWDPGLIATKQ